MTFPPKISNLMSVIRRKAEQGELILMPHAVERGLQRVISINDILQVLMTGWHESKKDQYRKEYSEWNYSIRGKSIDGRMLRVVVSFDKDNMLIITVIHLEKR